MTDCQDKLKYENGVFSLRVPSPECEEWLKTIQPAPMRGLGDVVERVARPVAKLLGLQDCGGCKDRQARLNKLVPFGRDPSPPPPTTGP